jgi:alpha-amylase
MRSICFYFQVHQPHRLKNYRFFQIGNDHQYYDDYQNRFIMRRVADKCYLPTNQLMLDLIREFGSGFKICYSISGTALDQFEQYAPEVLESFRQLEATGCVEFLSETYCHSLAALKSKDEFFAQIHLHRQRLKDLIGAETKAFRNTELIYSDGIGEMVAEMGFETMLTEGAKHILGWKSPNYLYCNAINPKLKLLLKNFRLSDDIAFRFSQQSWSEWPLTTEKFVDWLNSIDSQQQVVNLFMDYETFGEHQWPETGIFEFLRALPARVFSHSNYTFNTPSEVSHQLQPVSAVHVPYPISWADEERDLTAWLGNELQDDAFDRVYAAEHKVKMSGRDDLLWDWRYLQTSDHFYYMCTKWFSDGDVHKYFNPYGSPYEAYINYMNILSDFIARVEETSGERLDLDKTPELAKIIKREKPQKEKPTGRFKKLSDLKVLKKNELKKILKEIDLLDLWYATYGQKKDLTEWIVSGMTAKEQAQFVSFSQEYAKPGKESIEFSRDFILIKANTLFDQ